MKNLLILLALCFAIACLSSCGSATAETKPQLNTTERLNATERLNIAEDSRKDKIARGEMGAVVKFANDVQVVVTGTDLIGYDIHDSIHVVKAYYASGHDKTKWLVNNDTDLSLPDNYRDFNEVTGDRFELRKGRILRWTTIPSRL